MASGKLGSVDLVATTEASPYAVPAGKTATANVNIVNKNTTAVNVRLAIGSGANAAAADYIEYDTTIPARGVLERSGLAMSAGEKIFVYSSAANVAVRVHGFEE